MKKAILTVLSLLVVAALVVPGCAAPPPTPPPTSPTPPPTPPPPPKEPFKVGCSASMTGPFASAYLPVVEGVRIYIQKLNDAGGIDGRKIELYVEDDRAEGGLSISNFRKFIERDVDLLACAVSSALYAGLEVEAETANTPLIQLGSGSTTALLPPKGPKPLVFGGGIGMATPSCTLMGTMPPAFHFVKPPFSHGILTVDSPANRWFFPNYYDVKQVPALGLEPPVLTDYLSPAAPDPTPFALKFKETNPEVILYAGPSGPGFAVLEALGKMGWTGVWNTAGEGIEVVEERMKRGKVELSVPVSFFPADLPEHKEIKAAAKKYGVTTMNSYLVLGWTSAMAIEEMFRRTGYPATTERLLEVMNNFKFSQEPLRWGIEWTSTDHAGPCPWQGWYWNSDKGAFESTNWVWTDAFGLEWNDLGTKVLK